MINSLKSAAKSLVNLERLWAIACWFELIEPFIEYSAKLKIINFEYKNEILNLLALNKKCEKLIGARMFTIYLDETQYLAAMAEMVSMHFTAPR